MSRAWQAAAIYLLFLGVALAAMGWVSRRLLQFERAEAESQKTAAVEENVRLALWRMETLLAPLIVAESARPAHEYRAFHAGQNILTGNYSAVPGKLVLSASPLLVEQLPPYMKLYFQLGADGAVTSPQAPEGFEFGASINNFYNGGMIEGASKRLAELKAAVNETNFSALPVLSAETQYNAPAMQTAYVPPQAPEYSNEDTTQARRSREELQARVKSIYLANNNAVAQQQSAPMQKPGQAITAQQDGWTNAPNQSAATVVNPQPAPQYSGMLQPLWIKDELFLARRARLDGAETVQGIWLDWDGMRGWLLGEVRDLLPNARLEKIDAGADAGRARRLAALPLLLVPGAVPALDRAPRADILRPLIAAWVCLILAAVAVGSLIFGLITLSERRRSFVTAVSHELRTPLTTFSMYTEMLAGPLGEDAAKRAKYVRTLRAESRRLGHMVENILAYARLENTTRRSHKEEVDLSELVRRNTDTLRERCERQDMTLTLRLGEAGPFAVANQTAVEQILFNLVDNACKYGHTEERREVIVETVAAPAPGLRVSDRGPGIAAADMPALFKPFHKSAQKAAKTAPGVGLGLALSLRLAKEMGGDLKMVKGEAEGACFELVLNETA